MVKHVVRAAGRTIAAARVCRRLAPLYSPSLWRMVWRAHRLYRAGRFDPIEAHRLGLLRSAVPISEACAYVSRRELTSVQMALNPQSQAAMLKDKGEFYLRCAAHGLPIPRLYAIVVPGDGGWVAEGEAPRSPEAWVAYLESALPQEFVIKQITGSRSEGFDIFTRNGAAFRDSRGNRLSPPALMQRLRPTSDNRGWLLQERLTSHPNLAALSGTQCLQTLRLTTLLDRQGICHIVFAEQHIIPGDQISDNRVIDMVGTLDLTVNLANGVTGTGMQIHGDGFGPRYFERHPKTGRPFAGFVVPCWQEACELAKQAATCFQPIRTIGWDVAITPTGVYLVEGNIWWDNGKKWLDFRSVLERLKRDI